MSAVRPHSPAGAGDPAEDGRWPSPGDPGVEVLHPVFTIGAAIPFLIPWAFVILVLSFCSLVPGVYLGEAIVGDSPFALLITLPFAGGVAVGLTWLVLWLRRRVYRATTVLISPIGVHAWDHRGLEIRMRWEDVGSVSQLKGVSAPTLEARVVGAVIRELSALGQPIHPSAGLVGWGLRVLPQKLPRRESELLLGAGRRPGRNDQYEVAVPFNLAGPVNPQNRLVVSARHYRPDLFGAG